MYRAQFPLKCMKETGLGRKESARACALEGIVALMWICWFKF